MAIVSPAPNLIQQNDVAFGTSVSEAVANKLGSSLNYVLSNFDEYELGFTGGYYSGLTVPYASLATEVIRVNSEITDIFVSQQLSGSSGTTQFYILKNGVTIFSTDCFISSGAGSNVSFYANTGGTPSGVTKPVLSSTSLSAGDVIQIVLYTAAFQGRNLNVKVITRPV
jgi:hypothetical protein